MTLAGVPARTSAACAERVLPCVTRLPHPTTQPFGISDPLRTELCAPSHTCSPILMFTRSGNAFPDASSIIWCPSLSFIVQFQPVRRPLPMEMPEEQKKLVPVLQYPPSPKSIRPPSVALTQHPRLKLNPPWKTMSEAPSVPKKVVARDSSRPSGPLSTPMQIMPRLNSDASIRSVFFVMFRSRTCGAMYNGIFIPSFIPKQRTLTTRPRSTDKHFVAAAIIILFLPVFLIEAAATAETAAGILRRGTTCLESSANPEARNARHRSVQRIEYKEGA